jgi:hypothetical protein
VNADRDCYTVGEQSIATLPNVKEEERACIRQGFLAERTGGG